MDYFKLLIDSILLDPKLAFTKDVDFIVGRSDIQF